MRAVGERRVRVAVGGSEEEGRPLRGCKGGCAGRPRIKGLEGRFNACLPRLLGTAPTGGTA